MSDEMSDSDEGMRPAEEPAPESVGMPPVVGGEMSAGDMPAADMAPEEMPPGEVMPPMPPPPAPVAPPPPPAQYAPPPPPPYAPPVEVMPTRPGPASESSKILAALGYLFVIIAIVMMFVDPYKDEKFVKFHAVQAIAIWIAEVVVSIILVIPILGWLVYAAAALFLFVVAIIGLVKAFQGEYYEIPLVYPAVKSFIDE